MINRDALAEKVHDYGVAGTPKPDVVEREERRLEEQTTNPDSGTGAGQHHMEDRAEMSGKIKQLDCCLRLVNEPSLFEKLDGVISEETLIRGFSGLLLRSCFPSTGSSTRWSLLS